MKPALALLLVLILNTVSAQLSDAEFEKILSSSKSMMKRTNYETNVQSFNPISHIRQIEKSTWEVGLQSWAPAEADDKVLILKGKAIVKNFSDHFELYSVTQPVIYYLLEDIQQEKFVRAGQDWLIKELEFSQVKFGTEGSRLTMSANGDYG